MDKFKVKHAFKDVQDNGYVYELDSTYPREGYTPTKERIAELAGKNTRKKSYIDLTEDDSMLERLTVAELKQVAEERGIEGFKDMKKAELIEVLKA